MFHRIELKNIQLPNIYSKRKMVHRIERLFEIINSYLNKGYSFGSIEEARINPLILHLTFDDGYKEHLAVAKILKKRYSLSYNNITFSINIGNSYFQKNICMDFIYRLIELNRLNELIDIIKLETDDIQSIKKYLFSKSKVEIEKIFSSIPNIDLSNIFLNEGEVYILSKEFSIASHSMTHHFLTSSDELNYEIATSKKILEDKLNLKIETFCYPEGKNNILIQELCQKEGYKYALSIRGNLKNKFAISREVIH